MIRYLFSGKEYAPVGSIDKLAYGLVVAVITAIAFIWAVEVAYEAVDGNLLMLIVVGWLPFVIVFGLASVAMTVVSSVRYRLLGNRWMPVAIATLAILAVASFLGF